MDSPSRWGKNGGGRQARKAGRTPSSKSAVYSEKASFAGLRINLFGSLARSTHPHTTLIVKKGPRKGHPLRKSLGMDSTTLRAVPLKISTCRQPDLC